MKFNFMRTDEFVAAPPSMPMKRHLGRFWRRPANTERARKGATDVRSSHHHSNIRRHGGAAHEFGRDRLCRRTSRPNGLSSGKVSQCPNSGRDEEPALGGWLIRSQPEGQRQAEHRTREKKDECH